MKTQSDREVAPGLVAAFSSVFRPLLVEISGSEGAGATQSTGPVIDLPFDEAISKNPDLVVFSWPEIAIARAILDGEPLSAALERWKFEARICLSNIEGVDCRFLSSTEMCASALTERGSRGNEDPAAPSAAERADPSLLLVPAAALWLRDDTEVEALAAALETATGCPRFKFDAMAPDFVAGTANAYAAFRYPAASNDATLTTRALELCSADVGRLTTRVHDLERELEQYAQTGPLRHALTLAFRPITRLAGRLVRRIRRNSDLRLLDQTDLFDPDWYEDRFSDVKTGSMDPTLHFLLHGGKEGRPASPLFDTSNYLILNPDLRQMEINPLVHFLRVGRKEGRVAMTLHGHSVEEE